MTKRYEDIKSNCLKILIDTFSIDLRRSMPPSKQGGKSGKIHFEGESSKKGRISSGRRQGMLDESLVGSQKSAPREHYCPGESSHDIDVEDSEIGLAAGWPLQKDVMQCCIHGNPGAYVAACMDDGEVSVFGSAGRYAGFGMLGGKLWIVENADDRAGAFMKGGEIEIDGSAGDYVGFHMNDGLISVKGNVGEWACYGAQGGKIIVHGCVGENSFKNTSDGFSYELLSAHDNCVEEE